MAYRANHIESFIEKVNQEAEAAAQAIYDKHNDQLQSMVNNQVLPNQKFLIGMGTATISDRKKELPYDYAQKFLSAVANTQYNNISATFSLTDFSK